MKPIPNVDPDAFLGADGHLYVNAASVRLADRTGRRVIRAVALTPREEAELLRRIGETAGELLVGLTAGKGRAR